MQTKRVSIFSLSIYYFPRIKKKPVKKNIHREGIHTFDSFQHVCTPVIAVANCFFLLLLLLFSDNGPYNQYDIACPVALSSVPVSIFGISKLDCQFDTAHHQFVKSIIVPEVD